MKKMYILFLFSIIILYSCNFCGEDCTLNVDGCDEKLLTYTNHHFRIETFGIVHRRKEMASAYVITDRDNVDFETYFFELTRDIGDYAYTQQDDLVDIENDPHNCITSQGFVEKVDSIAIKTVFDFNQDFQAGDNINAMISMNSGDNTLTMNEYLVRTLEEKPTNQLLNLFLKEKPTAQSEFAIEVYIKLANDVSGTREFNDFTIVSETLMFN